MKHLNAKPNPALDNPFPVYAQLIQGDAERLIRTLREARDEVLHRKHYHYRDETETNMDRMRDLADMHRRIEQLSDMIEFARNMAQQK